MAKSIAGGVEIVNTLSTKNDGDYPLVKAESVGMNDGTTAEEVIKGKLDKNQGASNKGKVLGIGSDGNVIPVDAPTGGGGSGFSGDYNDLINKPTIPSKLSELTGDNNHRTVSDTEKQTWNNKAEKSEIPNVTGLATKAEVEKKANKGTTLTEYGITDATPKTHETDNNAHVDIRNDVTRLKEDLKGFVPKQQGAENNGKILGIGVDGVVTPVEKPSGGTGGETWRVIKEFTIPQDPNLEPSDVKYLVSDDGRITQFGVASDSENKPLELKKVFFHINKPTPFYDFASLTNILFRYNTFTGNYNLLQFYRHLKQETRILIGEIEKIGKYIKATASTFRVTTDYSWSSDTEKNVYVYNDIPENENITEICVSIFESANIKPDFRGATVTVLGVDA